MRGHIARKGKRYYAVVYEGPDPATGRPRHRWHAAGERRRDAEKLLNELVGQLHDGSYRRPERITVADYLNERWLPMKRSQLRATTWHSYEQMLRLHVVPALGARQLQQLTAHDLDALYADLLASGRARGKGGLAVKTVHYIHTIIRKALADAERKGTVTRNVAALADPPKLSAARQREMRIWTSEQLRQFIDLAKDHHLHAAWFLAAHTGMRRGEVLGLRWVDVNLDQARLSVRQAIVAVGYGMEISDVKTSNGRRTIDLDARTVAVLRRHKRQQNTQRLRLGPAYDDNGLVFALPDGQPFHPDHFSGHFDRLVARSGLPIIRPHDLRHTHASLLLKAGVPVKVVSERLGHANPGFTMTVYQHVIPGMQADAARTFSDLVHAPSVKD